MLFSKAIKWALGEPCSHFAIEFDDNIVFHSNFFGTHVQFSKSFYKKATLERKIDISSSLLKEEDVYQRLAGLEGEPYDWGGFLYFAWRALLFKILGKPLPGTNSWAVTGANLCIEVYKPIGELLGFEINGLSITSPFQLYLTLKDKYGVVPRS
jgi:hypothetical protein